MDSANKACSKPNTKTKVAELERMRNNQRRSRARRKDYIAELEEKIRRYESSRNQSAAAQTVQQLMQENDTLKKLLQSMGLGNDFLTAYTNASGISLEMSKTVAQHPQLDDKGCCGNKGSSYSDGGQKSAFGATLESDPPNSCLEADPALDTEGASQRLFQDQLSSLPSTEMFPWEFSFDLSSYIADASGPFQSPVLSPISPIAAQAAGNTTATEAVERPTSEENTTLCSVACSLVMMSNRKGYTVTDLDVKLRVGYRYDQATSEGCRIENRVLLSVLAEIL